MSDLPLAESRYGEKNVTDRQTLTPADIAKLWGLSKNSVYEALRRGEIPSVRVGRKFIIPADALNKLLSKQSI
jgi:excisionase family DNA binding protein